MDRYSARTDFRGPRLPLCGTSDEYGQNVNKAIHFSIAIHSYHDQTTPNGPLQRTTDFRRSRLPLCGTSDEYRQNLNKAIHFSIGIRSYHDQTTPNGLLVNTRFTSLLFFIILLDYEQFFKRSYEFPYDYTFIYNIFSFYIMDHSFLLPQNEKIVKAYNFLIKNLIPVRKVDSI